MTVFTLRAGFPEIELIPGMKLVLETVSPTTGAAITGVTTTAWAIYGDDLSQEGVELVGGSFLLTPAPETAA